MDKEPESDVLVEALVQTAERSQILQLCMEGLNPDYREALYLVYFEGMRHAEAGAVMRKSEKQIADLVYRGKILCEEPWKRRVSPHGTYD